MTELVHNFLWFFCIYMSMHIYWCDFQKLVILNFLCGSEIQEGHHSRLRFYHWTYATRLVMGKWIYNYSHYFEFSRILNNHSMVLNKVSIFNLGDRNPRCRPSHEMVLKLDHMGKWINKFSQKLLTRIKQKWLFDGPKRGRKHLWKVLYENCSFRFDPLTNMAVIGNSCFLLVDF